VKRLLLVCIVAVSTPTLVTAAGAIEGFEFRDGIEEARYQELVEELRCPKCLNTNLAGSDAPIAADLRREVHRLVTEGATDDEVRAYMRARYGDFVLYDPPLRPATAVLWALPIVLVIVAIAVMLTVLRRGRIAGQPLSQDERTRLDALVGGAEPSAARDGAHVERVE
jgi:cytochrome c-type biogenesis protein CcmH